MACKTLKFIFHVWIFGRRSHTIFNLSLSIFILISSRASYTPKISLLPCLVPEIAMKKTSKLGNWKRLSKIWAFEIWHWAPPPPLPSVTRKCSISYIFGYVDSALVYCDLKHINSIKVVLINFGFLENLKLWRNDLMKSYLI